jgi:hypothetical protein
MGSEGELGCRARGAGLSRRAAQRRRR